MVHPRLGGQLHRLATSIVAGDVVFFIGAGFSVESEGNTAGVLIARLLARFDAMTSAIIEDSTLTGSPAVPLCQDLRTVLQATFQVKPDRRGAICGKFYARNVRRLSQDYYLINDWMCSAFDALLEHIDVLQRLQPEIRRRELAHAANYSKRSPAHALRMPEVDFNDYKDLIRDEQAVGDEAGQRTAGKALFLDTMGFADDLVMTGDPLAPQFDDAMRSYRGRLRDRHATLAWLALEGVLPVVLTTNYDMLVEGAYRMAGMLPRVPGMRGQPATGLEWNRRLRYFTAISDATQFFSHGDGYASALIVKIHGCVRAYREHRRGDAAAWRRILRTLVFTFREIQNWREDSWSRDFVQTLLRTRTVAFAGYSTADPVMHDTFRSVYEEMARYRLPSPEEPASRANAFFFQFGPRLEFHGLEILRAATRAAGGPRPELTDHENLVRFAPPGKGFPTLDESMVWTFHCAYRQLQQQAIEGELRRVCYQLFGRPAPDQEALAVVDEFSRIVAEEEAALESLDLDAASRSPGGDAEIACRRDFHRIVRWTAEFHRSLMREYAAADLILRRPEGARRVNRAMKWPWYAPVNEHPDWAAWAVVIEIAIRKRGAAWLDAAGAEAAANAAEPIATDRAAVLVPGDAQNANDAPRVCLSVELPQLREGMRPRPFRIQRPIVWELRSHTVPWWVANDAHRPSSTPDPLTLWSWAIEPVRPRDNAGQGPRAFFGDPHAGNSQSADSDDSTAGVDARHGGTPRMQLGRGAAEV